MTKSTEIEWKTGEWNVAIEKPAGKVSYINVSGHICRYYGIKQNGNVEITTDGVKTTVPCFEVDHIPCGYKMTGAYYFVRLDSAMRYVEWLLKNHDLEALTPESALTTPKEVVQNLFTQMREFGGLHNKDEPEAFLWRFHMGSEAA